MTALRGNLTFEMHLVTRTESEDHSTRTDLQNMQSYLLRKIETKLSEVVIVKMASATHT